MALYGGRPQGRMMAYAIAAHHGGLANGFEDQKGGSTLDCRLHADHKIEDYPGWREQVPDLPTLQSLALDRRPLFDPQHLGFGIAFLTRMLFSCLVDADRLETERFYAQAYGTEPPSRGGAVTAQHLEQLRGFMAARGAPETPLDILRNEILDEGVGKAPLPPGFFTLTVPTGGGKTLTSLRFALEHALAHNLRRVVYVIPYRGAWIETCPKHSEQSPRWQPLRSS